MGPILLLQVFTFPHNPGFGMEQPDVFLAAITARLHTRSWGRRLAGFAEVDSTNTEALRWALEGAPEGAVVLADFQRAGRGRLGRSWRAAAGQNLLFSVVLRPRLSLEALGLVTLAASVAVAEAVAPWVAPVRPWVKWPNDLLLDGRKGGGMLLESTLQHGYPTVILGIGLNVNQATFPPDLAHTATSLYGVTGRLFDRAAVLADLLEHLERWYDTLSVDGGAAVRQAYQARLAWVGQPVTFHLADDHTPVSGILLGVTEAGALRLQTAQGEHVFHAGELMGGRGVGN